MRRHDIKELKERIDGRIVVASVSGGKDSAAMCLYLQELGIEHRRVFMDTGWEHPETYEYLRGPLTEKLGPIEEIRGKHTFVELVRKKKMFPGRLMRFCTKELKINPMIEYLDQLENEPLNVVGIRGAESVARSKMDEWEFMKNFDCEVWRPLIDWTLDDVIDIHRRHDLRPHPFYLKGAARIGCWPCIHVNKKQLKFMSSYDPDRIEEIAELERELGRNYFQPASGKEPLPIDKVVEWSRTSFGGKQFQLFDLDDRAGCMRWGLCDVGEEE